MKFVLPIRLVSEANLRTHWRAKAKRAKWQRGVSALHGRMGLLHLMKPPLLITLTRIGPRKWDSDNLAISCKAVRDGIADALGIDDGDERLEWKYAQRKGKPKEYAVEVEIVPQQPHGGRREA